MLSPEKELVSKMRLLFGGILCSLTSVSMTPLSFLGGPCIASMRIPAPRAKFSKEDLSGSLACFCVHLKCALWVSVLYENMGSLADSHVLLVSVPDRILPATAQ